MDKDTIRQMVNDYLKDSEMDDCFLVELSINGNKIEIFLDSDESVSFAKCRVLSRHLEETFDEKQWFGEKYTLEVSSAGVGRPLIYPRQYIKNIGRQIIFSDIEDNKYNGKLESASKESVNVEWEEKIKEGKKKKIVLLNKSLNYSEIKEAKIKATFNK